MLTLNSDGDERHAPMALEMNEWGTQAAGGREEPDHREYTVYGSQRDKPAEHRMSRIERRQKRVGETNGAVSETEPARGACARRRVCVRRGRGGARRA